MQQVLFLRFPLYLLFSFFKSGGPRSKQQHWVAKLFLDAGSYLHLVHTLKRCAICSPEYIRIFYMYIRFDCVLHVRGFGEGSVEQPN